MWNWHQPDKREDNSQRLHVWLHVNESVKGEYFFGNLSFFIYLKEVVEDIQTQIKLVTCDTLMHMFYGNFIIKEALILNNDRFGSKDKLPFGKIWPYISVSS